MNVNVTVELEINSVSASCHNRLFLSSPYLCVNKVFIRDLLRTRFRVSESCGLQGINF